MTLLSVWILWIPAHMSLLDKIRSAMGARKPEFVPADPSLMGPFAVLAACGHYDSLKKDVLERCATLNTGGVPSHEQWGQTMAELLAAYFSLCNLHVHGSLADANLSSFYAATMLAGLRNYANPEDLEFEAFVRAVFEDRELIDGAVNCYLRQSLSPEDHAAVEQCRVMLTISEDNRVHFFSCLLHLRLMRRLNISNRDLRFMYLSHANQIRINGFCKDALSRTIPVLAKGAGHGS